MLSSDMFNRIAETGRAWLAPLKGALLHFNESDGWAMASHVALSVLIAVFPFLIFTTSLAGFLSDETEAQAIVDLAFDYWPDEIAEPITEEIAVVTQGRAGFLTLGIVFALFFATNGVEAVRMALNRAYGDKDPRSLFKQRAQSLMFVLVGAVVMVVISVLLILAPIYFSFVELTSPSIYSAFFQSGSLRFFTAFALLVFVVFACHYWLPGHRRPLARVWRGVVLTLVLWVVVADLFSLYLGSFANYGATYAGLAGIMTALIFLYLMAVILIFGAEYNAAWEKTNTERNRIVSGSRK